MCPFARVAVMSVAADPSTAIGDEAGTALAKGPAPMGFLGFCRRYFRWRKFGSVSSKSLHQPAGSN